MRRQTLNKNVLKAMTIGIAAVIATTSVPMDVYASTPGESAPESGSQEAEGVSPQSGEPQGQESVQEPNIVTAEKVINDGDVATVKTVEAAVDNAANAYSDHANSVENETLKTKDGEIKNEINKVNDDVLKVSEALNNADLNNAIIQSEVAKQNIDLLEETLDNNYLQSSDMDNESPQAPRLQFGVSRTDEVAGYENGDPNKPVYSLELDEDGKPIIDNGSNVDADGNPINQFSYQYTSHGVTNRSVQGVYQWGMDEIKQAIAAADDEKIKEHLNKAEGYLLAAEGKLSDSEKVMLDAIAQYNAAKDAADSAEASLNNLQENVYAGVYASTDAARKQLEAAQDKAQQLTDIADQYYGLMLRYFQNEIGASTAVYEKNGKLDVEASAAKAVELTNNSKVTTGDGFDRDTTYALGRELLEQLVMFKLQSENATNITFGTAQNATDVDGTKYDQKKIEKTAVISKDSKGNDTVGYSDAGYHYYSNVTVAGSHGRMNHIQVTYTDSNNQLQTKYYNAVYKGTEHAGEDISEGLIYVAEVTYDANTNTWSYSEADDFLSDYNLTKGYRDAQEALDKAEKELTKLENEIEMLRSKVSANRESLDNLEAKYQKAKAAYEATKKSVQDFRDVYDMLSSGKLLRAEDPRFEDEEEEDGSDVISGTDIITDGETVIDAGDDGATVFDAGGVTITIPGGNTIPAGFTFNNVIAGGGANAAVGGGNAVIINDGGVPLDNGNGAAAQVAGAGSKVAKQNQAKKQNIKAIKDSAVPLANTPAEDGAKMSWYWLLIIFLLGAAGKKMYDEYKKKQEEEAAAKINK